MRSGKYKDGTYWAKPADGRFDEQCSWCFNAMGHPEDWWANRPGRWKTKSKYGIFVFGRKCDRDMFRSVWNKIANYPEIVRSLP